MVQHAGPADCHLTAVATATIRRTAPCSALVVYDVGRSAYGVGMWDVLTWHDGTLAIAWWAVIVLVVALLSIGGAAAARRK